MLKSHLPPDGLCLVVLTSLDLYEAASDLFVAGLASGSERTAVFSLARYDPRMRFSLELWHEAEVQGGQEWDAEMARLTVLSRGCKLLVHETLHLLGMAHCVHYSCCMNGSGHLEEDFRQPLFLCPVCLRKLSMLGEFDVKDRYRRMGEFFTEFQMAAEKEWIDERLKGK